MRKSKAILIVGGSGFIGTQLCLQLRDQFKVYSTYKNNPVRVRGITPVPMDATNRDWVKRIIYTLSPDIVVFAAGSNDLQWAEDNPRECDRVHSTAAVTIATTAGILQPRFLFLSNCFVFDGRKGNYKENDIVLPMNNLGKAKLSSEKYFMGSSNYVVVRSVPVYGRGNGRVLSYLDRLRLKIERKEKIELSTNSYHSYAPVNGLIDILCGLVDGGPRNTVLHYGGLTKVNEYEFAMRFAKHFGLNSDSIIPLDSPSGGFTGTSSPDFSLNCTKAAKALKFKPLLLEEGFESFRHSLVD